jgi:hypothetical protein
MYAGLVEARARSAASGARLMRDAHPPHLFAIIFSIEDVPFLAALENLFFLGTDLLTNLRVHLLFLFEQAQQEIYHVLADRSAVLDELNVIHRDENIGNNVGQADCFFPA